MSFSLTWAWRTWKKTFLITFLRATQAKFQFLWNWVVKSTYKLKWSKSEKNISRWWIQLLNLAQVIGKKHLKVSVFIFRNDMVFVMNCDINVSLLMLEMLADSFSYVWAGHMFSPLSKLWCLFPLIELEKSDTYMTGRVSSMNVPVHRY